MKDFYFRIWLITQGSLQGPGFFKKTNHFRNKKSHPVTGGFLRLVVMSFAAFKTQ